MTDHAQQHRFATAGEVAEYLRISRKTFKRHVEPHLRGIDIRHAALMDLGASTTDLTAIAYIAGHKNVTTTTKYVRGREQGAADAMAARQTTRPDEAGKGE